MGKSYDYDIVVVGGGPAGLSAAWSAAKKGARVAVLEREDAIGQSVRTSGVTWIREARSFGIPEECYNKVGRYAFYSPNNMIVKSSDQPEVAVLDVRRTYQHLAYEAAAAGAEIRLRTSVTGVVTEGARVAGVKATSLGGEAEFRSRLVIDASGFHSVVGRAAGIAPQWRRFGAGAEYEAYVENIDPMTWHLMVGQEYSPAGYAWVFPLGGNRARIGVGVGKPESQADATQRLIELLERRPRPLGEMGRIVPVEFHYGLIPNEGLRQAATADGLILVGDSAGQANPLVLEGIRYAIEFGRRAGEVGADAARSGDASRGALRGYEDSMRKAVGSKIASAIKVQYRWLGLTDEEWDREIGIIGDLSAEEFLDFVKAEFGLANMVKLATSHPKLAIRQLFGLIRESVQPRGD
ncbi:MAG: NAD(P)/FAD-dependent oxidoreductase [Thaumarchaeota archaeon]|nr:NAD(P)/FAD-dependent oxidoreductase [Nitrososphaerota archaeon]